MDMREKVSVIVPIYNAERYLKKCLDSILAQTLTDIEIVCVNDGSTDSSQQILEEYARMDERMKIIHKPNGGLVSARKAGIAAAKADYIGFVDSDDWVEPDMYEQLYKSIRESGTDLATSGYILEGNYVSYLTDTLDEGSYKGQEYIRMRDSSIWNLDKKDVGLRAALCCKLFKKDILAAAISRVSDSVSISEDKLTLISYLLECNSAVITHATYYHYMIHPESMTHKSNSQYLIKISEIYNCLLGLYEHEGFTEKMRMQSELYMIDRLFAGINSLLGFENANLFWIDIDYLREIPAGSRVAIYGGGDMGRKYHKQLTHAGFDIPICVDFGFERMEDKTLNLRAPSELLKVNFDYIIITIKNERKAAEIKAQLAGIGIPEDKMLWFRQRELFWKYAEADGLL